MNTKEEMVKILKERKVVLTGDETSAELKEIIKDSEPMPKEDPKDTMRAAGKILWLKSTAYVNDEQRLDAGLYAIEKVPVRLTKLPATVVEIFSGTVPSKKIAQIGRWAGLNPDGMKDKEILTKVLNSVVNYY